MRRLALFVLLSCPAFATIAEIGTPQAVAASSGTTLNSPSGFNSIGATLYTLALANIGDTTLVTVKDCFNNGTACTGTSTNAWNFLPTECASSTVCSGIWYAYSATGGGALQSGSGYTVTVSNASFPAFNLRAWSGTLTGATNPFDSAATGSGSSGGTNGNISSGTTTIQSGALLPSQNGSLVLTVGQTNGGSSVSVSSPFTSTVSLAQNVLTTADAYHIQTTATSDNATWNWGGVASSSSNIASFKAAVTAPSEVQRRH